MTRQTWRVPLPQSQQGAEHLVRAIRYAEPELESADILLIGDDLQIEVSQLAINGPRHKHIQATLNRLQQQSGNIRDSDETVVWSVAAPATQRQTTKTFLTRAGAAMLTGGQVSLIGVLDQWIKKLYSKLGPLSERSYGPVVHPSVLQRSGYVKNHPNFLMYITRPTSSVANYETLANATPTRLHEVDMAEPFAAFIPAQCLPTYDELRQDPGHSLSNQLITSVGPVARYERPYEDGLRRLTFYNVRELLILGDPDFVLRVRNHALDVFREAMTSLEVGAECTEAQDAFFASDLSAARIASQATMSAKFELRMPSSDDIYVAVASFNFAGESLTRAFDLNVRRRDLVSGCVGVGLERLALCLTHQLGSSDNVIDRIKDALEVC